jgi:hypothetical protein
LRSEIQQLLIRRPFIGNLLHKRFSCNHPLSIKSFGTAFQKHETNHTAISRLHTIDCFYGGRMARAEAGGCENYAPA